ncbi:18883_t:CDS:1, partial [Acaulospora morrowiae]
FIYCGIVDLRELDGTEVFKVLVAADELGLQKLIDNTQKFLIENRDNFLREDPAKMLCIVTCHETFDDIKKFCLETILADPDILFGSNKFLTLEESALMSILRCDDLLMDEINIWDCVIKWGMSRDPELKSNVESFKDQDFKELEDRLHNFIPLIRFHDISMEDFYLRVWPFKKILSEELVDDILRCYMVSKAIPRCNVYDPRDTSGLVNRKHFTLFASWIDQKSENYTRFNQIPYKFTHIYRASKDGNDASTFHQKCDNQGATIVVCKLENSERLAGGYNPLDWSGNGQYRYSPECFIFSIENCNDPTANNNVCRPAGSYSNSAVYCHISYGPIFGGGHDLQCTPPNQWNCNPYSYGSVNLPSSFKSSDFEVFKVEKK